MSNVEINGLQVNVSVTKPRIADLLCCAFDGGSNYWYQIVKFQEPPGGEESIDMSEYDSNDRTIYKHLHYPLHGGSVFVIDKEDDDSEVYELNFEAIQKGLRIFFEKHPSHAGDWQNENEDATTGDVFLQCCLFGEIVFA